MGHSDADPPPQKKIKKVLKNERLKMEYREQKRKQKNIDIDLLWRSLR